MRPPAPGMPQHDVGRAIEGRNPEIGDVVAVGRDLASEPAGASVTRAPV
jgi:hypothetical protein